MAASAPNTATTYYLDDKLKDNLCQKDFGDIDKACPPETDDQKAAKLKKQPGLLGKLKPRPKNPADKPKNPKENWVHDHCEFLMIKPSSPDEMLAELEQIPKKLAEDLGLKALEAAKDKLTQELTEAIEKKVAEVLAKKVAGRLVVRAASVLTGPLCLFINGAMVAYDAYDLPRTWDQVKNGFPEMQKKVTDATSKFDNAKKQVGDMQKALDHYKDPKTGKMKKEALVSDMMKGAAKMNDCIRKRKCLLIRFNRTKKHPKDGTGCCPGQTGHHVLPSAMFAGCSAYKEDAAPTICAEGTTNTHGSHGDTHRLLKGILGKLEDPQGNLIPQGAPITKDQAIEAGALSVKKSFPESGCDPDCIKAQLKAFYNNLGCTPKNEAGTDEGNGSGASSNTSSQSSPTIQP